MSTAISKSTTLTKQLLPLSVALSVIGLLAMVQSKVTRPMLLAERFVQYGGWVEILLLGGYAFFLMQKMLIQKNQARYRLFSWAVFSIVFFGQLLLGLLGVDECLMTGTLHLPVPTMILAGPIYRVEFSFMTILFLSTLVLSGPAWCSQFCYFGALDGLRANRGKATYLNNIWAFRWSMLFIVVSVSVLLMMFTVSISTAAMVGGGFGIVGLGVILAFSRQKKAMTHCMYYCPVGTIVSLSKFVNPIRISIDSDCTKCMQCVSACRYSAIDLKALELGTPKLQCTNCGDCLDTCHGKFIHYSLFKLQPETARRVYLFLTITIHVVFLGLARI